MTSPLPHPVLMLVTEPMERTRLTTIAQSAAAGGVNIIQLRDKTLSPLELTRTAAVLKLYLRESILVVNGSASVAAGAHADGVHLPEDGIRTKIAREKIGSESLIGRSVHSVETAVKAEREGADYLIAGTIFPSR